MGKVKGLHVKGILLALSLFPCLFARLLQGVSCLTLMLHQAFWLCPQQEFDMNLFWRRVFSLPQTYFLLTGALLGYLCLILWLRPRPVVLLSGGAIALAMISTWLWEFRPKQSPQERATANLLDQEIFLVQLTALEGNIPTLPESAWQRARHWAHKSQEFAQRIAEREATLIPELLETLHTVLDLSGQVVEALQVMSQIQTSAYRRLAQQRLQASCNRLRETHDQLQHLQDQIALATLDRGEAGLSSALPKRLQVLIADNKSTLQFSTGNSSQPLKRE